MDKKLVEVRVLIDEEIRDAILSSLNAGTFFFAGEQPKSFAQIAGLLLKKGFQKCAVLLE